VSWIETYVGGMRGGGGKSSFFASQLQDLKYEVPTATSFPIIFEGDIVGDWNDPSGKLPPAEFDNPYKLDPRVIRHLGETRMELGLPMFMSKPYHPDGDAVHPDSKSHSRWSLHRWGIDHSASARAHLQVESPGQLALACDWDCRSVGAEDLFDVYMQVLQKMDWTGIGLYPGWNRPGFHTDLRPPGHPSYRSHWFRGYDRQYFKLTWFNWKEEILLKQNPRALPSAP